MEVYPIIGTQKEVLYWTAILFSNSLGAAFGDFLRDNLGFSYLQGAMITGGIMVVVLFHYYSKINSILLFWVAFIFTKPFGATFGDFLTKPLEKVGLNLGTLNASIVCSLLILIIISFSKKEKQLKENN